MRHVDVALFATATALLIALILFAPFRTRPVALIVPTISQGFQ